MRAWICKAALVFSAFAWTAPAHALDPILMFLLSTARNMIAASAANKAPTVVVPAPSTRYPGTVVEPAELRRLIDESFLHLTRSQRAELFESLNSMLMDPKNAAVRGPMIEHFAQHAIAIREAHARLSQLSNREMRLLAREFRQESAALNEEQREDMLTVLRSGMLPVPSEFNQMLLAALTGPAVPSPQ